MRFFSVLLACILCLKLGAQNTWLQKASFGGVGRQGLSTFEINNKIYIVGGWDFTNYHKETWEFDPASNTWTQKANFPGIGRNTGFAFSLGNMGYYGTGDSTSGGFSNYLNDVWQYDPALDTWTQKNNFPGARGGAVAFVVNGNAYVGTGTSSAVTYLSDIWQYNPTSDTWIAKAPFGGTGRRYASAFVIGNKAYLGTGQGATGHGNTFYEYDPTNDSWTQKSGVPNGMSTAVGFAFNGKGYIGTGYDGASYLQGFYEYNPIADSWTAKANFGGGARGIAVGAAVNGKGYICAGYGAGLHNDMWEYTASTPTAPVAGFSMPSSVCLGTGTACFSITDQAANSPDQYTWYLTGSGTASATVQNPSNICYSSLGTYTVTQIVSNSFGSDTLSKTITIKSSPSVSIAAAAGTICAGQGVTLIASGASYYSWSSGNTTATVYVVPSTSSTYTVTGTASNGCTGTQTVHIVVNPKPNISIAGTHSICLNSSQMYTASGALTYTWSANAGGVNTNTIVVSPTVATTYTVTGNNSYNCQNTASVSVTILPVPNVTAGATGTACAGTSTTFTAGGASTYTWSTGATTASMSTIPPAGAIYTVTGKNSSNCTNTATVSANVIAGPTLTVAGSSSVICAGGTATLNAGGAATYTWSANAGSANTSTTAVSPLTSAVYSVTGSDANHCTATASLSVSVSVPAITIGGTPTVCAGSGASYTASGVDTYTWSTGENTAGIIITPSASATYSVAGTDINNCQGTATINITVAPVPTVTATASNSLICSGSTASLSAGGANTYTWSTGSLSPGITVSPGISTTYSVVGADLNQCRDTAFISISVLPAPSLSTTATGSICAGTSTILAASGASSYTWSNGATTSSISVNPAVSTQYTVTGSDSNNCTASQTLSVLVYTCTATGINETPGENRALMYPNPSSSIINIISSLDLQKAELTDLAGQLVLSEKLSGRQGQLQVSTLAPGIYFINIYSNSLVIRHEKIVIQR